MKQMHSCKAPFVQFSCQMFKSKTFILLHMTVKTLPNECVVIPDNDCSLQTIVISSGAVHGETEFLQHDRSHCKRLWSRPERYTVTQSFSSMTDFTTNDCDLVRSGTRWGRVSPAWQISLQTIVISSGAVHGDAEFLQHDRFHCKRLWSRPERYTVTQSFSSMTDFTTNDCDLVRSGTRWRRVSPAWQISLQTIVISSGAVHGEAEFLQHDRFHYKRLWSRPERYTVTQSFSSMTDFTANDCDLVRSGSWWCRVSPAWQISLQTIVISSGAVHGEAEFLQHDRFHYKRLWSRPERYTVTQSFSSMTDFTANDCDLVRSDTRWRRVSPAWQISLQMIVISSGAVHGEAEFLQHDRFHWKRLWSRPERFTVMRWCRVSPAWQISLQMIVISSGAIHGDAEFLQHDRFHWKRLWSRPERFTVMRWCRVSPAWQISLQTIVISSGAVHGDAEFLQHDRFHCKRLWSRPERFTVMRWCRVSPAWQISLETIVISSGAVHGDAEFLQHDRFHWKRLWSRPERFTVTQSFSSMTDFTTNDCDLVRSGSRWGRVSPAWQISLQMIVISSGAVHGEAEFLQHDRFHYKRLWSRPERFTVRQSFSSMTDFTTNDCDLVRSGTRWRRVSPAWQISLEGAERFASASALMFLMEAFPTIHWDPWLK